LRSCEAKPTDWALLPNDGEATTLAAALVRIACMSRIETVMRSLRR
jgi:hypothetical protein